MNELTIRLLVTALPEQPHPDPVDLGIQDTAGNVHPGQPLSKGGMRFVCRLELLRRPAGLDFGGQHVHGRPGARFLYLSWKRRAAGPAPWLQRVKVPLTDVEAAINPAKPILQADITGRRPHDVTPISWLAVAR